MDVMDSSPVGLLNMFEQVDSHLLCILGKPLLEVALGLTGAGKSDQQ